MANIYKQFDGRDIISVKKEVTRGVFTGGLTTLTEFYTGSQADETTAIGRALYHLDVYNAPTSQADSAVQFSLAYGHHSGYGTPLLSVDNSSRRPTKAVYSQYSNTLLPATQAKFTFYTSSNAGLIPDGHTSDDIFVINFSRRRIKEKLDEGNFRIMLKGDGGTTLTLIDESDNITNPTIGPGGVVYNLAKGSINAATAGADIDSYYAPNGEGYGKIYPESGIVVLNPSAIHSEIGVAGAKSLEGSTTNTGAGTYDNLHFGLYEALKNTEGVQNGGILARSSENVSSQNYFIRVRNNEFNFSNNPTYVTGSNNQIIDSLYNEPITYITSIGLYNATNELLAIAKVSKPVQNGRDAESLIKLKVDF